MRPRRNPAPLISAVIRHAIHGGPVVRSGRTMRTLISGLLLSLLSALSPTWLLPAAHAQGGSAGATTPRIEWEVKHRFRLFRNETDFQRHVAATRNDGVLGAERRLAVSSDGRGWARDILERLCR